MKRLINQRCEYMHDLISQLEILEGEGKRSSISIIQELNANIREAQDMGYRVAAIHEEIAKTIDIDLASFKTLLYRVRKNTNSHTTVSKPVGVKCKNDSTTQNASTATSNSGHKDLTSATERSKNKLASFGKGK